ncbi:hypothetical protein OKZ62_001728 [Vibrio navarrensis]|nr:hypothetical protein [Vibrio navarrensis]
MEQLILFNLDVDASSEFWGAWTDEEITKMQEGMLIDALKEISDGRKSPKMRKEAIDWIMRESIHPFSADVCAQISGYNIATLRAYLRPIVKRLTI